MILLIDNYDSFTYNLYQYLMQLTHEVVVKRNDALSLNDIATLKPDAIVISPGPGRPENAGLCIPLVQQFSGQIPILGICLGHQAIAAAFGATITQAKIIMHGKTSRLFHQRRQLFENLPNPFTVGRYHSLTVAPHTLSEPLTVTATTTAGTIMAIQHQQHLTFGLQFHPESILTEHGQQCLGNFINIFTEKPHVN